MEKLREKRMNGFITKTLYNKKILLLFLAVEVLLLLGLCLLYSRREPVSLSFTQDELYFSNEEQGFYLDNSNPDRYIATPQFSLPKGLYTVNVKYEKAGAAKMWAVYRDERFRSNLSGDIIAGEEGSVSFGIRVAFEDRPIQVRAKGEGNPEEGEYLLVRSITVADSPVAFRYFLFKMLSFLFLLDLLLFLYVYRRRLWPSGEERMITGALAVLVLLCSLPLMVDYLPGTSHDLQFHLMRIEGIREGLEDGMFPVKIQPNLLKGYGYATSVFYGDLFLYIPAALRLMGVSIQEAYQFYIFLVNLATVLSAFFCFSKMSGKRTGVICAAVYSLNIYRLSCIYTRAAVGEYTALVFLPIILYGLWRLYQNAYREEKDNESWVVIACGCAGVAMCHMISCITVACFVLLICLIMWKKTFSRRTLFSLIKAACLLVGLTLWFFVPMLDYMANGVYGINSEESYIPYALEDGAASVAQVLLGAFRATGTSFNQESGIAGEMPLTPGAASLLVFGMCVLFYLKKGIGTEKKSVVKETFFCMALCLLSLCLSTGLIPYTSLAEKIELLQLPERAIQYPWRFLSPAAVLFAWLVCLFMKKDFGDRKRKELAAAGILCVALCQGMVYMSDFLSESGALHIYQEGNLTSMEISNREYLPVEAEIEDFTEELEYASDAIQVSDWYREDFAIEMELTNSSQEEQSVLVPFLYYKGYEATDEEGMRLETRQGNSGKVEIRIPEAYEGKITVQFREPWYWRICEGISLVCLAGVFMRNRICRYFWKKRTSL